MNLSQNEENTYADVDHVDSTNVLMIDSTISRQLREYSQHSVTIGVDERFLSLLMLK